jgi:hypothetical protein
VDDHLGFGERAPLAKDVERSEAGPKGRGMVEATPCRAIPPSPPNKKCPNAGLFFMQSREDENSQGGVSGHCSRKMPSFARRARRA